MIRAARQGLLALAAGASLLALPAGAQTSVDAAALAKLSNGLTQVVGSTATPVLPWVKQVTGGLLVQVIVSTNDDSPTLLASLTQTVLALGGAVHYVYPSLHMMAVMLPAPRLLDLARNANVASIAPNGAVVRTASLLQRVSGAGDVPVSSVISGSTLDGSGVGIAVLDSGIAWTHRNFAGSSLFGLPGPTRVRQTLDFPKLRSAFADGGWAPMKATCRL